MKQSTITLVIILISVALTGLVCLQMYWIKQAATLNRQQFQASVYRAMQNVTERLERRQVQDYVSKEVAIPSESNTNTSFFSGVSLKQIDPVQARKLNIGNQTALLVESITPGSVAWNAGVRERDVITKVHRPTRYFNSFSELDWSENNQNYGDALQRMMQTRSRECFEEGLKLLEYDFNFLIGGSQSLKPPKNYSSNAIAQNDLYNAFLTDSLMQSYFECDDDKLQTAFTSQKTNIMSTQSRISSMVVRMLASPESVSEKICRHNLEQIINEEFREVGITQKPEWSVLDNDGRLVANSNNYNINKPIDFQVPIFQDNFFHGQTSLSLYFSNKDAGFRLLSASSLAGLLFISTIIGCFYYTVNLLLSQKKISELKTDFINNMTHELKTPVSTIKLASDMMLDKSIPKTEARIDRFMSIISQENDRLTHQIEKVLQIAKLEKGQEKLHLENMNINEILNEILERSTIQIENKKGELIKQLKAQNALVEADKVHLTNMLSNLLDNAIKYTPNNPVIEVATRNENGGLIVSFKDNGIGMSKEVQKRIFEKFYREPTGNLHNVKGFGLGLSYVKYMIEAHGGWINVFSRKNKGSNFELFFPQKNA